MSDNSRIEDLRRRVQMDPASIAFAQLAEEYRRAGRHQESVDVCRAGLAIHPGYLSARVTLGRALIEIGALDEAQQELAVVLRTAPDNLAAIRGLAEIHHKRGDLNEALAQYRVALTLARNDPDLEETVRDLTRQLGSNRREEPHDGLSLEQMQHELNGRAAATGPVPPVSTRPDTPSHGADIRPEQLDKGPDGGNDRPLRTVAALEQWLAAIHVARASRRA